MNAITSNARYAATSGSGDILVEGTDGRLDRFRIGTLSGDVPRYRRIDGSDAGFMDTPLLWHQQADQQWRRIGSSTLWKIRSDGRNVTQIGDFKTPLTAVCADGKTGFIVAQVDGSLHRLSESGALTQLPVPKSLSPYQVHFLAFDQGVLWVGTNRHLWQLKFSEDGSRVIQMNARFSSGREDLTRQAYTRLPGNVIVIVASSGITRIRMQGYEPAFGTPIVYISDISLPGGSITETRYSNTVGGFYRQLEVPQLSYSNREIGFVFKGSTYSAAPDQLTFSWKLVGAYDDWSEPSARTSVQFAGLSPGTYMFDVRVCNSNGVCKGLSQPWEFTILKPVWQQWWFIGLGALLLLAIAMVLIKARDRRILRDQKVRQRMLEARVTTLELEQKARQLQMNPHFIFNALQTISARLTSGDNKQVQQDLNRFSRLMRSALAMSRESAVSLEDEIEFLKSYVDVENLSRGDHKTFEINVDPGIEPFDTMLPPMLLQPLVENAVRYGGDKISMNVKLRGRQLVIEVSDNGEGFDPSIIVTKESVALNLIRERIEALGQLASLSFDRNNDQGGIPRFVVRLTLPSDHSA